MNCCRAQENQNRSHLALWKRYLIAALLCLAFMAGAEAFGAAELLGIVLYSAAFAAGMRYPLAETVVSLREWRLDVDFLMLLVAAAAWYLGHPAEGALLLVLFGASRAMEAYARERTHASVQDLLGEIPQQVLRLEEGEPREVSLDELATGDLLLVRPGDRVSVDCLVEDGATAVDLAALTGESVPRLVAPGDEVPSGAINGRAALKVRVTRPAAESAWQKIIQLIENAPARRSPAQVLSEKVGRVFTIIILSASALAFLLWWQFAGLSAGEAAYRAMVLLVAGSPCAIVLSIPSAILAAITRGTRQGTLFNGGLALSSLNQVRVVAFDKTGTLTTGEPAVARLEWLGKEDGALLGAARRLALSSSHPASRAVAAFLGETADVTDVHNIQERPGQGVVGEWKESEIHLGRARGCEALQQGQDGNSLVVLYRAGLPEARFHLTEAPRPEARETVDALKERGLAVMMLSGDAHGAVRLMAQQLNIEDARAELTPSRKWEIVQREAEQRGILMVGDGVNDAPALSVATVGAAMGLRGSAATLAQADLVLTKDVLSGLPEAVDLARRTQRIIRQNLTIAIGAAAIMIVFALMGSLPLVLGVFGHEGGTVLVVLNSLRLLIREDDISTPSERTRERRPAEDQVMVTVK